MAYVGKWNTPAGEATYVRLIPHLVRPGQMRVQVEYWADEAARRERDNREAARKLARDEGREYIAPAGRPPLPLNGGLGRPLRDWEQAGLPIVVDVVMDMSDTAPNAWVQAYLALRTFLAFAGAEEG